MKITILAPQRRKPQIGDRRVTKKHGLQIRVVETVCGMWVKSGSRFCYEWRKPEALFGTTWAYLLTHDDLDAIGREEFVKDHLLDVERAILFGHA